MDLVCWLRRQFKDGRADEAREHAERTTAVLDDSADARRQARQAIHQWECASLTREAALFDLWGRPPWSQRRRAR